eukprot:TRINITY_DN2389_c0_g1_i5.p1 TRINITY_DN2389_c0_g1~~TRINITY_DN2389_c0_g1_i5.p1  ORF type:complete len:288 (-),score=49.96 TRINITY_DN2389_c0_g1_i5:336-1199(-)
MCLQYIFFFFLMIRRPPRSTLSSSSAASDVYKRQVSTQSTGVVQLDATVVQQPATVVQQPSEMAGVSVARALLSAGHGDSGSSNFDAHGWLMTIAFAVVCVSLLTVRDLGWQLMPLGAIVSALGRTQLVDLPKWWIVHAVIQSVAVILAVAGLISAYDNTSEHWHNWHSKLGLAVVVLVAFQAVAGAVRPGAVCGDANGVAHAVWVVGHRMLAGVIFILAIVNILEGMELNSVETVSKAGFVVCVVLMALIYVSILLITTFNKTHNTPEVEDTTETADMQIEEQKKT